MGMQEADRICKQLNLKTTLFSGRTHFQRARSGASFQAQSIGEPATQMTLKTFHFAGVVLA